MFLKAHKVAYTEHEYEYVERGGTEVIVNFSAAVLHLPVSGPRRILLSTDPGAEAVPDALVLPPRSALVVTTGTD